MSKYITLFEYTQRGIENVEESPNRLDSFREVVEERGGEIADFYLTMGAYDLVAVLEFPDDETAAKVLLGLGRLGNVTTETLKAFTEDEFESIVADLP
ncbi:GYD domain-containing protein [Halegenticoccus tardaugens]|uniref:GYD domain-containing protein n=1 Tax=Halegenticoccus tardaugens TaxID=2071624 RepID=UPI00100B1D00|nr:GYD domain-containing protein [Halegenticoccus tardaugens]